MTRNSVSNVGILNCIMTGNYLLSVRLPLCCYRDINVSTTRRSFLPDLAKYPALLQFPQRWRYVNLANRPYISTTFADVLARRLQWFPWNWYFDLRPFLTVTTNRVIVRFIANMLDNMQRGRIWRQTESLTFRLKEQRFQPCLPICTFGNARSSG